jgi:hypothetical protein
MKEAVGVMECWSNGMMGAANVTVSLRSTHPTGLLCRREQANQLFHVVDRFQIPHRRD